NTEYPVEEYQTQTGDYKLFEDTDSNPSEVTDSELVQFNLSETDVDCMSEEETANQAVVEDLITLEEDNSKQPEITPYLIFSESSHTSGGGSSKITKEEEPTGSNQEKDSEDKQEITEEENEDTDTDSTDTDSTDTDSTDSDQEDGDKTVESPTKKLTEFENKTNQEPVEPYEINSDQESDTLYVRHTSSSEEASPEKKNKEREIISETNLEDSDKEIQIPSPTKMSTMTAMDASQTVGNLSNIFQGVTAMAPSTTSGSTEGYNIIGTFGDYFKPHCWSKNCKELVNYEGEKCRSCNQCARHGCDGTAPEVRKWCSDCRYKCKVPGCHKNRKPGEHNCENHSKEEPAPCAWSGCKQPAETSRDFCKECQENVNKMCEVWQCYEPKCNESAQFCRGCWDKKYEEAKRQQQTSISQSSNQTKSNSTSGSGSNEVPVVTIQNQGRSGSGTTTIELGSDGKPTYECLIDACDKRVRTKGEKCEDHKYCEHVGCKEEAPFAFRYCKRCQLCCRADGCFSTREWKKAYCKSHLTTKAVPCAIFGCKRKTGDQAWEFCNECVKEIIKLGEKTGCDVCQIPDPSCYDCQCVRILQEYNEIRKEALKSKNVTFDTQSSSSTTAGSSTTGGPRPILRNHTNSIISSISPLTGNNSSFISSASSNSIGTSLREQRLVELPTFDGAGEDPYHWWKSFNDACNANNISLERRLQIVPSFLKGQANVWWKMASPFTTVWEVPQNGVNEHVSFKKQFFDYFCTQFHRQNWMEQLRSREQMAHEDVDAYAGALADLYQKVDPLNRYPEEDKMQQFLKGLQPAIRMMTELNTPNNWNEAWQQAKKVENALKRGSIGNPLLQPANVNQALINQMAKMEETIQVLHTEVKENKETCTNCNRKGHVAKNCYAKSIKYNDVPQKLCHNCGRKGHWAKDCYASKQCNNCNGKGHLAKDCNKGVKCYGLKAIVDTGSSGSIISKQCLDQLKRKIEESSNVSLIGINGQKHRPLGMSRLVKSYKWSNIHWRKDFNHYCLWDNQQTSYKGRKAA
ncbi:617_t:CDS:2, partial [Entrophospora sp. SA101]